MGEMMKEKYLGNRDIDDSLRQWQKKFKGASNVRKRLMKAYDLLGNWISWKVRWSNKLIIGKDPWIGWTRNHRLFEALCLALNKIGIKIMNISSRVEDQGLGFQIWKNVEDRIIGRYGWKMESLGQFIKSQCYTLEGFRQWV